MVKKISVHIMQCIDVAMFPGHCKTKITGAETTEGCPVNPGSTLNKTLKLVPNLKNCKKMAGIAVDGNLKCVDSNLASSTLLQDENSKDICGMVISYTAKVKLFLGAIGGELSAELPFILMHPKPNMKQIMKADTFAESDLKPSSSIDNFEFDEKNKDV